MTEKKKCKQDANCKEGRHTFMVTSWHIKGGQQKAVGIRCRHCLMPLNLQELECKEWREQEGI